MTAYKEVFTSGGLKLWSLLLMLILFLVNSLNVNAQSAFLEVEDSLKVIAADIQKGRQDFDRFSASERFLTLLQTALKEERSFQYPFDSLKTISILTPPDESFRLFTWTIPKNDGSFDFSGIIQENTGKGSPSKLFVLSDHSAEIQSPETQTLEAENWYGALYYKMIQQEYNDHIYYTLLGWDGNTAMSRKKVIVVLSFRPNGKPVFGASLFNQFPRKVKRVIFEYSAQTSMSLTYSTQQIDQKIRKGKKRVIIKEEKELIVFDRLVPTDPALEGQYAFYIPETNIQDGFIFEKGKWNFVKEVDARNPEKTGKKKQFRQPELELLPPVKEEKK
ncbi:MAG: hypothetical protein NTU44_19915 [Bacteroidetes bacterium]|nr:hypothetical protein [Bacteroidota bacterium]